MAGYILMFPFFLLSASYSYSQVIASATLDTTTILIGQQVMLNLQLKHPPNSTVQWPSLPDTLGGIEIVSRGPIDTVRSTGSIIERRQLIAITAFDSGTYTIPAIPFYSSASNDTVPAAISNLLEIKVNLVPVDTTKNFKPIKGIADVPFNWRDYILYIVIGLAVIIIVLIGIYIYMRIKKRRLLPGIFVKEPEVPAHEIALSALKELDNGKHWQNGQYKFFHSSISEIIRTYIEKRWNVPALEQTTDEILSNVVIDSLNREVKQRLNYLLRIADLAKFAKLQPLAHENEQSMREALGFVTDTIPVAVPEVKEVKEG